MNTTEQYESDALLATMILMVFFLGFLGAALVFDSAMVGPFDRQLIQHQTGGRVAR